MRARLDIPLKIGEIIAATGGFAPHIINKNEEIHAITTDSREMYRNDLYIALQGERLDGEDYCNEAKMVGCHFVSARHQGGIVVDSTKNALLSIASYYRNKLRRLKRVIAITGSVGKTTTKELLFSIIRSCAQTHATKDNYNNYIGLAHTVLSAPHNTEYLIAEIGMNHPGEIGSCSRAIKPDIGVITRIGTAHIGNLGSRKMIAKAKLEILEGMSDSGTLLIPYGEEELYVPNKRKTFSLIDKNADFCLIPTESSEGRTSFTFATNGKDVLHGNVSIIGDGNLRALGFSIACAVESGFNLNNIAGSFCLLSEKNTRQKTIKWKDRLIIDDSYNASLESMISSFEFMRHFPGRRCAVLGDIYELGSETEAIHFKVGAEAARNGIDKLFLFGIYAPFIKRGAILSGLEEDSVFLNSDLTDHEATINAIKSFTAPGDVILFKGSHACHLDSLISKLLLEGDC